MCVGFRATCMLMAVYFAEAKQDHVAAILLATMLVVFSYLVSFVRLVLCLNLGGVGLVPIRAIGVNKRGRRCDQNALLQDMTWTKWFIRRVQNVCDGFVGFFVNGLCVALGAAFAYHVMA